MFGLFGNTLSFVFTIFLVGFIEVNGVDWRIVMLTSMALTLWITWATLVNYTLLLSIIRLSATVLFIDLICVWTMSVPYAYTKLPYSSLGSILPIRIGFIPPLIMADVVGVAVFTTLVWLLMRALGAKRDVVTQT